MARKKTEKTPMPATDTAAEMKAVRLYLPADVQQRLRVLAAEEGTNMALMARKIVMEYVAKRPRGEKHS